MQPAGADAHPVIVTLLTDFGLSDVYVGVMKGVLHARAPRARLVDLTHAVSPQAVDEGAFLLEGAARYFPPGTVHLAVVDPGVGTSRRRIALRGGGQLFVGPDNGLLSAAVPASVRPVRPAGEAYAADPVALPPSVEAVAIENAGLFLSRVSATFEGRDVFAPVAAYLAAGGNFGDLGPRVQIIQAFPSFRARLLGDELDGRVLHVDHFGNLVTDIRGEDVSPRAAVLIADRALSLSRTYATSPGLVALIGSSGYLEVALADGSAAAALGVGRGARVTVVP